MSTEHRLARLGLAHLANNPKELKKVLEDLERKDTENKRVITDEIK